MCERERVKLGLKKYIVNNNVSGVRSFFKIVFCLKPAEPESDGYTNNLNSNSYSIKNCPEGLITFQWKWNAIPIDSGSMHGLKIFC